jgi:hypothetical protein
MTGGHFGLNFLLGGIFLVFGLLLWIFPRDRSNLKPGQKLAPVLPLVLSALSLVSGGIALLSSRNDPAPLTNARLIVTPTGLKIAALDELTHFDLVGIFGGRGAHWQWKEQRLLVFDVATKRRVFRKSLQGSGLYLPIELMGDFGGKIGVRPTGGGFRSHQLSLLDVEDGRVLGGPELLTAAIQAKNPGFKTIRETTMNSSQCLEVRTADYRMIVEPHGLVAIRGDHCDPKPGTGEDRLVFDKRIEVSLRRVRHDVPAGATPLNDTHESRLSFDNVAPGATRTSSRVDPNRTYQNPRFAIDSRTGQMLLFNHNGLLLYREEGQLMGAAVSQTELLWQARLPNNLTEVTYVDGRIVAIGPAAATLIDPSTGQLTATFPLE